MKCDEVIPPFFSYCDSVSWDGSQYHGWQKQHPAVRWHHCGLSDGCERPQPAVHWSNKCENASDRCAAAAATACCGLRCGTDSGVHALYQICQLTL